MLRLCDPFMGTWIDSYVPKMILLTSQSQSIQFLALEALAGTSPGNSEDHTTEQGSGMRIMKM